MSKLKAGRTFDFVLKEYRGDPEADVFKLRVLSGDQQTEMLAIFKEGLALANDDPRKVELTDKLLEIAVAVNPLGCRLLSVLTSQECSEIIAASMQGASLTSDERKKFVLRPTSEAEKPAEAVTETAG